MLDDGVHATLEELALANGLAPSSVSRVLRLTLLAPEIVEAILDGRPPAALQLDDLLKAFALVWAGQCQSWEPSAARLGPVEIHFEFRMVAAA